MKANAFASRKRPRQKRKSVDASMSSRFTAMEAVSSVATLRDSVATREICKGEPSGLKIVCNAA